MMRSFRYTGPATSVTLRMEDGSDLEMGLTNGQTVDLPEESSYVVGLVASSRLQPLPPVKVTRRTAPDAAPDPTTATS